MRRQDRLDDPRKIVMLDGLLVDPSFAHQHALPGFEGARLSMHFLTTVSKSGFSGLLFAGQALAQPTEMAGEFARSNTDLGAQCLLLLAQVTHPRIQLRVPRHGDREQLSPGRFDALKSCQFISQGFQILSIQAASDPMNSSKNVGAAIMNRRRPRISNTGWAMWARSRG